MKREEEKKVSGVVCCVLCVDIGIEKCAWTKRINKKCSYNHH